jgi:hypothetical protein
VTVSERLVQARTELAQLRADLAQLIDENAKLAADKAILVATCAVLQAELAALRATSMPITPNQSCTGCGIRLEGALGLVCHRHPCPSGLGGPWCGDVPPTYTV